MTAGSPTITSATGLFLPFMNGKLASVRGAGTSGATRVGTVTYVSATTATHSVNAVTTVSGATMYWGTDDTTAWNLAIDAAGAYAATSKGGGVVLHPHGSSLLAGGVFKKYSNIGVVGGGKDVSVMVAMADMNLLTLGSSISEDLGR